MAKDGPTPLERFLRGIIPENPVFRQVLGTCPTLAITGTVRQAITMSAAVMFVLICANLITSMIRNLLKPHLRILVFTLTIAAFVTIADKFLAAFVPDMSEKLGPYIPLIVVNCIIICRCEVCASKQGLAASAADAVGQGLGNTLALVAMATVRELLGSGSWFDIPLFWKEGTAGEQFRWSIMNQPPGAFITFGLLLGAVVWIDQLHQKRAAAAKR
ncbi:MAG TPA: electron transport complex subunit RsxE [Phycisphaerales bacterium]|nr:electron transport complex subunit RsxE [Phycisphaerales bacterium]